MNIALYPVVDGDWLTSAEFALANEAGVLFVELGGEEPARMERSDTGNYLSQGGSVCPIHQGQFLLARDIRLIALKLDRQVAVVQRFKVGDDQPAGTYVIDLFEDPANPEHPSGAIMFLRAMGGFVKPTSDGVSGKLVVTVIGGGFNSLHSRLWAACKDKFEIVYEKDVPRPINADQSFAIIEL